MWIREPDILKKKEHKKKNQKGPVSSTRSEISQAFMQQQEPLKVFISRLIRRPQDIDDIAQETFVRAFLAEQKGTIQHPKACLLYTSPSPRDRQKSRMPSSA